MTGRFAPSPTGDLHLGNLRTALIAWLAARSAGESFLLRTEDLDVVAASDEHERAQQDDLRAIGIDWDGAVWRQRDRFPVYRDALAGARGAWPHVRVLLLTAGDPGVRRGSARQRGSGVPGHVPRSVAGGTGGAAGGARAGDPLSVRRGARSRSTTWSRAATGPSPHDVVLRRNDGVPAYNLAVVVDDAAQGVDLVVRGDDLLPSTPTQVAILRALGHPAPRYAHVPLVVGADGRRLAKRDGAITLADLASLGVSADTVRSALAVSIGVWPTAVSPSMRATSSTDSTSLRSPRSAAIRFP